MTQKMQAAIVEVFVLPRVGITCALAKLVRIHR
jgi:hypothetical protein